MGILNVTPDSFSDGGLHTRDALEHAFRMIDEGADIIDIGGESTRPGFTPVSAAEEIGRILPVLRDLVGSTGVPISVDTMKPEVAEAAIGAGADIINDVYGLRAEGMAQLIASSGVATVIMHMHGDPGTLHSETMEGDAVSGIIEFLRGCRHKGGQDYHGSRGGVREEPFSECGDRRVGREVLPRPSCARGGIKEAIPEDPAAGYERRRGHGRDVPQSGARRGRYGQGA